MKQIGIFSALMVFGSALVSGQEKPAESCTSNDLFVMFGSDFVRPGRAPKSNYNIGLGHTFAFLKKNPSGDELTFAYTYENGGSHGFLQTISVRTRRTPE